VRIQAAILVVILLLVIIVSAVNWQLFTEPSVLNLVVRKVEAPLGVVMLGVVGVLTALYLLFTAGTWASALVETRRYARDMQEARRLADEAESSRFTELRGFLGEELEALRAVVQEESQGVREAVDQSHNSLVANLGELDDRLGGRGAGSGFSRTGDG